VLPLEKELIELTLNKLSNILSLYPKSTGIKLVLVRSDCGTHFAPVTFTLPYEIYVHYIFNFSKCPSITIPLSESDLIPPVDFPSHRLIND